MDKREHQLYLYRREEAQLLWGNIFWEIAKVCAPNKVICIKVKDHVPLWHIISEGKKIPPEDVPERYNFPNE